MFRGISVFIIIVVLLYLTLSSIDSRVVMSDEAFTIIQKIETVDQEYSYKYLLTTGKSRKLSVNSDGVFIHEPEFWWKSSKNYDVGDIIWMGARWGKHYEQQKE